MKKLLLKLVIYGFFILIILEVLVRVLHLTKDYPVRFVDERGVERWVPHQEGYSVTGNRRQNFSKFNINSSGYNSYRDFKPSKDKTELALVGDSFIEGFHQHYYNSIGKKIENELKDVEVYEIGYAGYDFADQLHVIHQYPSFFNLIDHVVIGLKFEDDLTRGEYGILNERMKLETPMYRNMRKIKLLVYLQNIGAFSAAREMTKTLISLVQGQNNISQNKIEESNTIQKRYSKYIENFKKLVNTYGYDKTRFVLLLDKEHTPEVFLDFLDKNAYTYIDFGKKINQSKIPTTLIYDQHWNNHGRTMVSNVISEYFKKRIKN
jgi:hypothetical protein